MSVKSLQLTFLASFNEVERTYNQVRYEGCVDNKLIDSMHAHFNKVDVTWEQLIEVFDPLFTDTVGNNQSFRLAIELYEKELRESYSIVPYSRPGRSLYCGDQITINPMVFVKVRNLILSKEMSVELRYHLRMIRHELACAMRRIQRSNPINPE